MQGGHGGYGHAGYGYGSDAGASAGGGYGGGYDAGAAYGGYDSAAGYGYYSSGGYPSSAYEDPVAAGRRAAHGLPAPPLDGLELQPSESCPRNYVIFDQTHTDSRVTFHPSLAHRLGGGSSSGQHGGAGAGNAAGKEADDAEEEIDALLLSSEDDDAASSPDSACSSSRRGGKKGRVKKMMRTLKGIVPGADQMDTPAALDEAVRYLKSLKLDATNKLVGARRSHR